MLQFLKKPYRWAVVFSLITTLSVTYILMDTFVIPRAGTVFASNISASVEGTVSISDTTTEETSADTISEYKDSNIQITISTVNKYNTYFYVADIKVSSAAYFKTAFAKNTYGRNIKQTTSVMAENNNAIFAINGDYYGFRNYGFVLRNGVLYRSTSGDGDALVIDKSGNFSIADESTADAQNLADKGAWQILSFGPALVNNGEITVNSGSEVGQSMASNPRTAIGQVSSLHYIVIVSDGRTSESEGLSLLQLAQEMKARGCTIAYNLDGGGSSTMWFNGNIINNPVSNGSSSGERSVSDIVYFGY